jgi:hypothetical protein
MKPLIYTGIETPSTDAEQLKVKYILMKNKIEYDEQILHLEDRARAMPELVMNIRKSGHAGTYKELSKLPILECNEKTYPAKVITDSTRLLKIIAEGDDLEKSKYVPPTPKKIHDEPIVNMDEDTATRVNKTMEFIVNSNVATSVIESMLGKFTEDEKHAFLVGYRLASHSTARKMLRIESRIHVMAREIDPHIKD